MGLGGFAGFGFGCGNEFCVGWYDVVDTLLGLFCELFVLSGFWVVLERLRSYGLF